MSDAELAPRDGSGAMFDGIADGYDRLNRVLSLGLDRGWRRRTVAALALAPSARVLDLATGTADLALALLRAHPGATVVGVDPSPRMLSIGRHKAEAAGLESRFRIAVGAAEALPLADGSVDAVMMAFGIRNVPERARALAEIRRVCRPGARVAILELSDPREGPLSLVLRLHIRVVVPLVGALLGARREYRYLERSIARFPSPRAFAAELEGAGFADVTARPLTFGVCQLFVGTAPGAAVRR